MLLNTIFPVGMPEVADRMGFETTGTVLDGFPAGVGANRLSGRAAGRAAKSGRDGDGPWIDCDEAAGVVEVHDPRVLGRGHEAFCRALVRAAVVEFGAHRAEVSLETATCRLDFGPGRIDRAGMAQRVASAVRAATPAIREGAGASDTGEPISCEAALGGLIRPVDLELVLDEGASGDDADGAPSRRRRLVHLAMAGGSLTLAAAAVILPGLPTLPFLVMTGRHAAVVSPRVERILRSHPWSAAILAEAETASGSSIEWGSLLKMLAVGILFAVAIWLLQPPMLVVLGLELALMICLGLREWLGSDLAEVALDVIA